MRRIALLLACLAASVVLVIFLVPARASAPTAAGLHKGAANGGPANEGVQPVRRGGGGFHGGGFRGGGAGFRGGRSFAWHGGGVRRAGGWGGGRGFAWRGGPRRAVVWRGGRAFGWHGGVRRAGVWRGGRVYAWHGGRRFWRGPRWGWGVGTAALAAPYFYSSGASCPLVRRTVWVRRCW
jgi:hypothetical protein